MVNFDAILSGAQCRAARALLGWSQDDLAGRADVSRATVNKLEAGRDLSSLALKALRAAFERDGVLFVEDGDTVGGTPASLGVALRRDQA